MGISFFYSCLENWWPWTQPLQKETDSFIQGSWFWWPQVCPTGFLPHISPGIWYGHSCKYYCFACNPNSMTVWPKCSYALIPGATGLVELHPSMSFLQESLACPNSSLDLLTTTTIVTLFVCLSFCEALIGLFKKYCTIWVCLWWQVQWLSNIP